MHAVSTYFAELNVAVGAWWNRFWFTPSTAVKVAALRITTGLMALYAVASYGPDLELWFGENGMLPLDLIRQLYRPEAQWLGQRSLLDVLPTAAIWPFYWVSLAVVVLYTLGIGGRVTAILSTIATISFFARAPLLIGEFESILTLLMIYLCIAKSSDALSMTSLWRKSSSLQPPGASLHPLSAANTISIGLIQIHIAVVHLMMGWGQLATPEHAWWSGEGIWLAAARPGMSLVDLSGLANHPRMVAAWSHAMTLYLLAFPVLAWKPLARPLLLVVGALVWSSFAIASGWVLFCLAMLTGLAAFVDLPSRPDRRVS